MKDFITISGSLLIVFMGFIGLVFYGQYLFDKNIGCPRFAENVERPYKFDFFAGGCFVQTTTGQWVAKHNYWNNPVLQ